MISAEDITHDAVVAILDRAVRADRADRAEDLFTTEKGTVAYFYKTALNKAANSRRRAPAEVSYNMDHLVDESQSSIEKVLIDREIVAERSFFALKKSIGDALSEREWTVLEGYAHGYDTHRIACSLGCSSSVVYVLRCRAIKKLRDRLSHPLRVRLAGRLQEIMNRRKVSRATLASLFGVKKITVSRWLRGEKLIPEDAVPLLVRWIVSRIVPTAEELAGTKRGPVQKRTVTA